MPHEAGPVRRLLLVLALGAGVALVAAPASRALAQGSAVGTPEWKREFEEVCAKTQDAMALPLEELRGLVSRCDKLKPHIEKLDESQRKVYSRRLQVCRDLYQFVLESRQKE
jgi:hypothetical protein